MRLPILLIVAMAIVACASERSGQTVNRDTLTQRQMDSILANSKIPNARAVGRAMTAADSASARALRADSVARDTTER
jgi:hypothetical protein